MNDFVSRSRLDSSAADADTVWVYQYTYWDDETRTHRRSERYATADAIRCGLGTPAFETGKRIDRAALIDGAFAD